MIRSSYIPTLQLALQPIIAVAATPKLREAQSTLTNSYSIYSVFPWAPNRGSFHMEGLWRVKKRRQGELASTKLGQFNWHYTSVVLRYGFRMLRPRPRVFAVYAFSRRAAVSISGLLISRVVSLDSSQRAHYRSAKWRKRYQIWQPARSKTVTLDAVASRFASFVITQPFQLHSRCVSVCLCDATYNLCHE